MATGDGKGWCLLCTKPFLPEEKGTDDSCKLERRNFFAEVVLVLHKLLQVPLLEVSNFLVTEEGKDSIKFCSECAQLIEEGKALLGESERIQIRLQNVQATLQNKLFTDPNTDDQTRDPSWSRENDERAGLRDLIRDETRISLSCVSSPFVVRDRESRKSDVGEVETAFVPTETKEEVSPLVADQVNEGGKEVIDLAESDDDGGVEGKNIIRVRALDDIVTEEFTNFGYEQYSSGYSSDAVSNRSISPVARKRCRTSLDSPMSEGSSHSQSPILMNHLVNGNGAGTGTLPGSSAGQVQTLGVIEPQQRVAAANVSRFAGQTWVPVWQGSLQCNLPSQEDPSLKVIHDLRCKMHSNLVDSVPVISTEGWPPSFFFQAVSKQIVRHLQKYLKDSKFTLINFEAKDSGEVCMLKEKLGQGGTGHGCVGLLRFRGATPPCTDKIMVVMYLQSNGIFNGAIPRNQEMFAMELAKVLLAIQYRQQLRAAPVQLHHQTQTQEKEGSSVLTVVPIGRSAVHHFGTTPLQQSSSSSVLAVQSQHSSNSQFTVQQQLGVLPLISTSVINGVNNPSGFN